MYGRKWPVARRVNSNALDIASLCIDWLWRHNAWRHSIRWKAPTPLLWLPWPMAAAQDRKRITIERKKRTRVENCSTGVTTLCSEDMMIGCWGWSSLIISQTKLPVLIEYSVVTQRQNDKQRRSLFPHWTLNTALLLYCFVLYCLYCHLPTSKETSRQRPTFQLSANLQPLSHIQNNRTCCKILTYCSPCLQWSSQSQPVCLLQVSLHWTALLYIHDHLINAIGSQKLSCLCLLDLPLLTPSTTTS